MKVLKIFDFNGAGKQAKRRQWRMKQACFEEGSQTADTLYPFLGYLRAKSRLRRLRSETRLRA